MTSAIEEKQHAIADICRKYGVKRLDLFGSAARSDSHSEPNDVDFFYEFEATHALCLADRFFGLIEDLETLLGKDVDLVSANDAVNPYFLQVANQHRIALYAA